MVGKALVLLIVATITAASAASVSSAPPAAPNVLIIVTDDQRVDTFAVMPRTRQLFMDEGITFTNAFATTPLCCQSRASIMTGRYAHNHGVRYFAPEKLDQSTTVQAYLKENGYRTGIYGKYLNDWNIGDPPPFFDDWAVFPQSSEKTYAGGTWNVNGTVGPITDYSTHFLLERAVRFLRAAESEELSPWYMYVSTPAPHPPFVAEDRYASAPVSKWEADPSVFETDRGDKPSYVRAFEPRCGFSCGEEVRTQQLRTLMSVDTMVGDLFAEMDRLLETTNTLAIFISDNGFFWGEHGLAGKKPPYLPGVKVPLMLRWPLGALPADDDRVAANIDVAPTILEAAGIPPPPTPMDGRSLLSESEREQLLLEYWRGDGVPTWAALISNGYQYVENDRPNKDQKTFSEYYDLIEDPYELVNLLRDREAHTGPSGQRLRQLQRALDKARSCAGSDCP